MTTTRKDKPAVGDWVLPAYRRSRGTSESPPTLSMQCFDNRHGDCRGDCSPFFSEPCGCACHGERAKTEENRPPR